MYARRVVLAKEIGKNYLIKSLFSTFKNQEQSKSPCFICSIETSNK